MENYFQLFGRSVAGSLGRSFSDLHKSQVTVVSVGSQAMPCSLEAWKDPVPPKGSLHGKEFIYIFLGLGSCFKGRERELHLYKKVFNLNFFSKLLNFP